VGLPRLRLCSSRTVQLVLKAAIDRLAGLLLLGLFTPLLLLLAVLIKVESPGPIFFRQIRVGYRGRHFRVWKFRSMYVDAERLRERLLSRNEAEGPLFKMRRDPRITLVGLVLRKLSLDELPQLMNVVAGQMSLVGPRPALPAEVDRYNETERRRLEVSPGMTGMWQVSGRSSLSWSDAVRLDLEYVDRWSLMLDVRILLRTIPAVLTGKGAY
jgi:exopolysaccharide biosynthesis polyprenyl glycosylphosphotransferase